MALRRTKVQSAYGLGDALLTIPPQPIIAVRNPASNDRAELGTLWINRTNNTVYCITSVVNDLATWTILS